MNRRDFIAGMASVGGAMALGGCKVWIASEQATAGVIPSYWCTWCREVALAADKGRRTELLFPGDQGAIGARDTIDERSLFGSDGWARFYPSERGDLLLVIDDGWDVPYGLDPWKNDMPKFGSLEPEARRFPSFGATAIERLTGIVGRTKDLGWKGLGIWVACQCPGETNTCQFAPAKVDEWLKRKLDESARSGVEYWKVDWGVRHRDADYRARMTELKRRYYPELVIEHMPYHSEPVLPDDFSRTVDCPFNRTMVEVSDVIRTYDVQPPLNLAVTLRRIAEYSHLIDRAGSAAALNVEDEIVVGAVLSHGIGIMRGPKDRPLETHAAVAWQRISPPFGARAGWLTRCSEHSLVERHTFGENEAWYAPVNGKTIEVAAPAVMARGMALPKVTTRSGETPYVIAGRHPNGAMSVAVLPRHIDGCRMVGEVEVELSDTLCEGKPLAVFGCPQTLRLPCSRTAVWQLRDLATDESVPLRDTVSRDGILTLLSDDIGNRSAVVLEAKCGRM